ncbi:MAG: LysM peptidoglycan-binding domain-containing protein [Anaerolineae bacterium]|nr:LysM peptidoglycan-binding domain-containing protein [Anaerolineae bacterium]
MGTNLRDDITFLRSRRMLIIGGILLIVAIVVGLIFAFGGRDEPEEAVIASPVASLTPTSSPSPRPTEEAPPTEPPPPAATATLEPYQYVVQAGDTLYFIIQQFGYRDLSVIPELLALNGMTSPDDPIPADTVLLIPRQTPTPGGPTLGPTNTLEPGAESAEETPSAPSETGDYRGCNLENRCMSPDGQYWMHEIAEGETVSYLAYVYNTTVPDILNDNGLTQDSLISVGDILRIYIRVTLTPTLTPTGAPDSTATPTPTPSPPTLLAPADNSVIDRSETVVLQWAATHPLYAGTYYLITLRDIETDQTFQAATRSNVYRLPASLQPDGGDSIVYEWDVVVIDGDDVDAEQISGDGETWRFTWGTP